METTSVSKIYSLNKSTYINLRWIGIIGQFLTLNIVYFLFKFDFNFYLTNLIIFLGILFNAEFKITYDIGLVEIFAILFLTIVLIICPTVNIPFLTIP